MALFRSPYFPGRLTALTLSAATVAGCLDRPLETTEPNNTSTVSEKLPQSRVDKIDLVLMIDNSSSMADKQTILADAVPDLVKGLVYPLCLDEQGAPAKVQPASPVDKCPAGTDREFEPVLDIHIGIISSSLGGHGNPGTCSTTDKTGKVVNPSNDDQAHLLSRRDASQPTGGSNVVDTYQGKGFLAWDPAQKLPIPGTKDVGDTMGAPGLIPTLHDLVKGVGQSGCGYEAQLESWYRFLVDPEPYQEIKVESGKAVMHETDGVLLAQRAEFLRPSSLVAVIMLTDENDCSFVEGGNYYAYADKDRHLARARHECSVNPDDPCCAPCGAAPSSCPADPTCTAPLTPGEDDTGSLQNLRCYNPKQRFGIDFLQPVDRYVKALQSEKVPNRAGDLVENPLYPSLKASGDVNARTPDSGLVFLAGIVGVPWQDIARRNAQGKPDLLGGLDQSQRPVGGFKSARELTEKDASGATTWDQIIGDPAAHKAPTDALMIESQKPRVGMTPATGDVAAPTSASSPTQNPVNGHEWIPSPESGGDLQYACTFKLPVPQQDMCEASEADAKNPLCQDDATGQYTTTKYRAKGYPGVRELDVLKGVGDQGIVASVCPAQLDDPTRKDYGYHPAIGAIIDRLKQKLSGQCLHRSLTPDANHQVSCLILEGRKTPEGQCSCAGPGLEARKDVLTEHLPAKEEALADPVSQVGGLNCFCEIKQLEGEGLTVCQNDTKRAPLTSSGQQADGWCYIDATSRPPTGAPSLVDNCAATEKRKIRFVGKGEQLPDTNLFITCSGQ